MIPEVLTIQKGRGKAKYPGEEALFVPDAKGSFALGINTAVKNNKQDVVACKDSLASFRCVSVDDIYQINPFSKG